MSLRRTVLSLDQYIRARPLGHIEGPQCAICNDVVDYEALVEGYPGYADKDGNIVEQAGSDFCRVLVRCHGAEELREFQFGGRLWTPEDLRKAMQRVLWFDPTEMVVERPHSVVR